MKKIGEAMCKALLAVGLFVKYILIENFRGFLGLVGLGFIIVGWLMLMISFSVKGICIFGVGLIIELIVWVTGPITIKITKDGEK